MKLFKKSEKPKLLDKKYTEIEYYTFKEPCYKCGQPIINGSFYPNTVQEKYWNRTLEGRGLEGLPVQTCQNQEIKDGWMIMTYKYFYMHWTCPTEKVEVPKEISERANFNIKEF
jgi:hypothetical protein